MATVKCYTSPASWTEQDISWVTSQSLMSISHSPPIADGTIYVGINIGQFIGIKGGSLYAVDAETGEQKWRFEGEGSIGPPAIADSSIYLSIHEGRHDGGLYVLRDESPE